VWRVKDLQSLDPKLHVARIAHTVGENKRVQIIEEAKKANIRILNPGLKKPAEAVPEVAPEAAPEPAASTEPTPETPQGEKKAAEPPQQEPKAKKKAKPKTAKKGKGKK
jgi:hypothetical protein